MTNPKRGGSCAVVVGLDHYIGLQTARVLSRRAVPVVGVLDDARHPYARTNCCDELVTAPTVTDPLIDTLLSYGGRLEEKAVLYPCKDTTVLLVSRHRDALAPYYHVALPAHEVVELLVHKKSFYEYALAEDIAIAKTFIIRNRAELEAAATGLSFPCTLKPSLKTPGWESHTYHKALRLADRQHLDDAFEECRSWAEELVLQEWIPGDDSTLYACNAYFPANGGTPLTFVSKSLRKWYPDTGNTSLGKTCRCDEVERAALELFGGLGFHGLAYLEMKQDAGDGRFYVMEPNVGRPTGKSALADACGVELLYTMYCDKTGRSWPEAATRPEAPSASRSPATTAKKWIHLRHDVQSAIRHRQRGQLTVAGWWASLRGDKVYAVWSRDDPRPFLGDMAASLRRFARRLLRRDGRDDVGGHP